MKSLLNCLWVGIVLVIDLVYSSQNCLFENLKCYLEYLKGLYLGENQIETIDGSFNDLVKLEALDLRRNLIKTISNDSFKDLISLSSLMLGMNRIELIEEEAFRNLSNLKTLDLKDNKIAFLQDSHFKYLKSVIKAVVFNSCVKLLSSVVEVEFNCVELCKVL